MKKGQPSESATVFSVNSMSAQIDKWRGKVVKGESAYFNCVGKNVAETEQSQSIQSGEGTKDSAVDKSEHYKSIRERQITKRALLTRFSDHLNVFPSEAMDKKIRNFGREATSTRLSRVKMDEAEQKLLSFHKDAQAGYIKIDEWFDRELQKFNCFLANENQKIELGDGGYTHEREWDIRFQVMMKKHEASKEQIRVMTAVSKATLPSDHLLANMNQGAKKTARMFNEKEMTVAEGEVVQNQ